MTATMLKSFIAENIFWPEDGGRGISRQPAGIIIGAVDLAKKDPDVTAAEWAACRNAAGCSALAVVLAHYEISAIKGFHPELLTNQLLLSPLASRTSKSGRQETKSLVDFLLFEKDWSKNEPKNLIRPEWLDWAQKQKDAYWQRDGIDTSAARRFVANVPPEYMTAYWPVVQQIAEAAFKELPGDRRVKFVGPAKALLWSMKVRSLAEDSTAAEPVRVGCVGL